MEPDEVTQTIQDIDRDDSAAANSNLGNGASECPNPILNVGIFFDGTYNDAYDDSIPRTNVHRLYSIYKTSQRGDNIRVEGGNCVEEAFEAAYIQGIGAAPTFYEGSLAGAVERTIGGSTGYGPVGVFDRLEQGTNQLRNAILAYGGFDGVQEVRVDVFGFSRGAATARIFCNALADAGVPKLTIRFLGLFDTVGSFGIPGDQNETYLRASEPQGFTIGFGITPGVVPMESRSLDMTVRPSTADTVFHITAIDELRAFFPLTRATGGNTTEVNMPGSHGDVGGAYFSRLVTEHYTNQDVNRAPFLRTQGWLDNAERTYWNDRHGNARAGGYTRTVLPRLTMASLFAMHAQASNATVPLLALESGRMGEDVSVPGPLTGIAGTLAGGASIDPVTARRIRADYSHRSWAGLGPNMLEGDFERDEYENQP